MEQKIKINNSKGQKLVGLYSPNNSKKIIVICHGFKDSKDVFAVKELTKYFIKNKFSTFRFDFTGHGESEGSFDNNLMQQVEDVKSVTTYFKKKHKEIIVIGGSLGALTSCLSTMENNDVFKLITINGFFFLNFFNIAWKFSKYLIILCLTGLINKNIRKIFLFYFNKFNPSKIKVPVLVICAKKDEKVSYKQSLKFYFLLNSEKSLKIMNNIDHGLTKKDYVVDVGKKIINWLK